MSCSWKPGEWPNYLGSYNHMGDLEEVSCLWLQIGPNPEIVVIWEVNQWMDLLCFSVIIHCM